MTEVPGIKVEYEQENEGLEAPEELRVFSGDADFPPPGFSGSSGNRDPGSPWEIDSSMAVTATESVRKLSRDYNQKRRDILSESLFGQKHREIKQVILDTLGIQECDEEQFDQFADLLKVDDSVITEEEESERRSIPGIHYPVAGPGFHFSGVGPFSSVLHPMVIRTAQNQMKKSVNRAARSKAFAWKMILLFFDKREFSLQTFKFCIRQTLDDADSTLCQCSAFVAKIVRMAIAIYENPQAMAREELKIRTNEIMIQLHKNVSKVSAEMRGCTWNSSAKKQVLGRKRKLPFISLEDAADMVLPRNDKFDLRLDRT